MPDAVFTANSNFIEFINQFIYGLNCDFTIVCERTRAVKRVYVICEITEITF